MVIPFPALRTVLLLLWHCPRSCQAFGTKLILCSEQPVLGENLWVRISKLQVYYEKCRLQSALKLAPKYAGRTMLMPRDLERKGMLELSILAVFCGPGLLCYV